MTKNRVRFLHTSDWQLGMTRHYLSGEAQARFTADRIDAVRRIGALARSLDAEFIVVAGDVFEHANLSRADLWRALEAMGETGVPIYLLPGNHDPLDAVSIYRKDDFTEHQPESVHVLDRLGVIEVRPGVELVAAPWVGKHPESDPVAGALEGLTADGTLRIVVGHGMVSGVTYSDAESDAQVCREPLDGALAAGLVHYVALGDRHIRWASQDGAIRYSGTHESTSFTETDRGHVLEVDLASDALCVTEHEVGRWLHLVVDQDIAGDEDIEALDELLGARQSKEHTIVRYKLHGTVTLAQSARLDEVLERHGAVFASLGPWQKFSDVVTIPDETDFEELALSGYLRDAMVDLRDASAGGDDEEAADALRLLYRLAGPKKGGRR